MKIEGLVSSVVWREMLQRSTSSLLEGSEQNRPLTLSSSAINRPLTVCAAPHHRVNVTVIDLGDSPITMSGASSERTAAALGAAGAGGGTVAFATVSSLYDPEGGKGDSLKRSQSLPTPKLATSQLETPQCLHPMVTVADVRRMDLKSNGSSSRQTAVTCAGKSRNGVAYISMTNCVQIWINISAPLAVEFLVRYEAFGCAPIVAPRGTWTQYNSFQSERQQSGTASATAVVRCNETTESWHLICRGTEWIGTVGNCSSGFITPDLAAEEEWSFLRLFATAANFPFGIVIVISLGVALGVTIGALMLAAVIAFMRRRYRLQTSRLNCKRAHSFQPRETQTHGTVRTVSKTWKACAVELFTSHRSHRRQSGIATSLPSNYRKPDVISAVSGASGGGNSITAGVSWQRFRPLPIPTTRGDERLRHTTRNSSSTTHHQRAPPTSDSQQPLLSIDVAQVGAVSYGIRENQFQISAVSNRRRQVESTDSSSSTFLLPPTSSGHGPSAAWLPVPDVAAPELPSSRPVSLADPATSGGHNAAGNDESSPYYFKLDPALTQKNRRVRSGCEPDRRQRSRYDMGDSDWPAAISTGCYMCDTDVIMSSR